MVYHENKINKKNKIHISGYIIWCSSCFFEIFFVNFDVFKSSVFINLFFIKNIFANHNVLLYYHEKNYSLLEK